MINDIIRVLVDLCTVKHLKTFIINQLEAPQDYTSPVEAIFSSSESVYYLELSTTKLRSVTQHLAKCQCSKLCKPVGLRVSY